MNNFTETHIETHLPIDDTMTCDNCGNDVYIMHEFTRLPNLMKEIGEQEFMEWFTDLEIEAECSTCYHTLHMSYAHETEMNLAKDFILNLIHPKE